MVVRERPGEGYPGRHESGDDNPGDRRSPDVSQHQRQAGRRQDEGCHPRKVQRAEQQDDGGQREDGVGDTALVTGGAEQTGPHDS